MNINTAIDKLNKIIKNKEIQLVEPIYVFSGCDEVENLVNALILTRKHPEIEVCLKELLENFSIAELNNLDSNNTTILHHMVLESNNISLNSFEIVINFGINVNNQNINKRTPLHFMYYASTLSEHTLNIINLFVKNGANLNIMDYENKTVLDNITNFNLDEHLKIIIMVLVDFGIKNNNFYGRANVLEFIESYRSSSIKLAIKK